MRVVLTSDTHLPKRAKVLPDELLVAIDDADVVIHAGDWVDLATFELLDARSERLIACWGNNDGPELRAQMPERADVTIDGLRITVTHETGVSTGRDHRMSLAYPDTDILVFGHSHIPWDTTTDTGLRLLNPGSPTDRRRQPHCTYMTTTIADGVLGDVRLHEL
nr:metallophosphoesterase [Williamsia maris]